MAIVTPNLTEVPGTLPIGNHNARVVECDLKTSKAGNQMLKWKFETVGATEPTLNGISVWTNTMIEGKGAFRFQQIYSAITGEDFTADTEFDTEQVLGQELVIGVQEGKDQNGNPSKYPDVASFARA